SPPGDAEGTLSRLPPETPDTPEAGRHPRHVAHRPLVCADHPRVGPRSPSILRIGPRPAAPEDVGKLELSHDHRNITNNSTAAITASGATAAATATQVLAPVVSAICLRRFVRGPGYRPGTWTSPR